MFPAIIIILGLAMSAELPVIDKLWDWENAAVSEQRFREVLPKARDSGNAGYYVELLTQLGTTVGGQLRIGGEPFVIRGTIAQEPGRRIGAFSFGARVLVSLADLRATGGRSPGAGRSARRTGPGRGATPFSSRTRPRLDPCRPGRTAACSASRSGTAGPPRCGFPC